MKRMKTVITAAALSALLVTSNPIGAGTANAWHRHHWRHRHPVGFGAGVGVGVGVDFFIPAPVIEIRERPRFVVVEEVEDVQVAEDVDYDIFYSGGRYWYFDVDEEEWFVASSWGGPFVFVEFDECPVGLFYVPFGFWHVRPWRQVERTVDLRLNEDRHDRERGQERQDSVRHENAPSID